MYRAKIEEFKIWKESPMRKPLVVRGARQVGKTWLIKEFGRLYYEQTVYINFENAVELHNLFDNGFQIAPIIQALQIYSRQTIQADTTLIVFDEIQAVPLGITALKYFCEDAPQYHIIAAGSLLGIGLHGSISFPVGKVNFIDLYPMTFDEFLIATGETELQQCLAAKDWPTVSLFHNRLTEYVKTYYYTGGMPEVVDEYVTNGNLQTVREIQQEILRDYEADFAKHAPLSIVQRINMVWGSLASQLAKENKKFVYGIIREGARAKDFELAIQWLAESGLVTACRRIKEPRIPLAAYQELSVFKLYFLDVGLLGAMTGLNAQTLLEGNRLFTEFKGALTEQYVMQQLHERDYVGYWTNDRSTAEVDFIVQQQGNVIPIEVKAETNVKAKSFKLFCKKYQPQHAVRTSLLPYADEGWMTNVPLYGVAHI